MEERSRYVQHLEDRVETLEGDMRLLQRKIRGQELNRFELTKAAVIEILNGNRMTIIFDECQSEQSKPTRDSSRYGPSQRTGTTSSSSKISNGHRDNDYFAVGTRQTLPASQRTLTFDISPRAQRKRRMVSSNLNSGVDFESTDDEPVTSRPSSSRRKYSMSSESPAEDPSYRRVIKTPRKTRHQAPPKLVVTKVEPDTEFDSTSRKVREIKVAKVPVQVKSEVKIKTENGESSRPRNITYALFKTFTEASECVNFLKSDVYSRVRSRRPVAEGQKEGYSCKQEAVCPFRKYVLYPTGGGAELYKSEEDHNHPVIPFGIPEDARQFIQSLVESGMKTGTRDISAAMVKNGHGSVKLALIDNFVSTLV